LDLTLSPVSWFIILTFYFNEFKQVKKKKAKKIVCVIVYSQLQNGALEDGHHLMTADP